MSNVPEQRFTIGQQVYFVEVFEDHEYLGDHPCESCGRSISGTIKHVRDVRDPVQCVVVSAVLTTWELSPELVYDLSVEKDGKLPKHATYEDCNQNQIFTRKRDADRYVKRKLKEFEADDCLSARHRS